MVINVWTIRQSKTSPAPTQPREGHSVRGLVGDVGAEAMLLLYIFGGRHTTAQTLKKRIYNTSSFIIAASGISPGCSWPQLHTHLVLLSPSLL